MKDLFKWIKPSVSERAINKIYSYSLILSLCHPERSRRIFLINFGGASFEWSEMQSGTAKCWVRLDLCKKISLPKVRDYASVEMTNLKRFFSAFRMTVKQKSPDFNRGFQIIPYCDGGAIRHISVCILL
jgi:hypothetical protein